MLSVIMLSIVMLKVVMLSLQRRLKYPKKLKSMMFSVEWNDIMISQNFIIKILKILNKLQKSDF